MSATAVDPRRVLEREVAELAGLDGRVLARLRRHVESLSNDELCAWLDGPLFASARWQALSPEARGRLIAEALDETERR